MTFDLKCALATKLTKWENMSNNMFHNVQKKEKKILRQSKKRKRLSIDLHTYRLTNFDLISFSKSVCNVVW